MAEGIVIDTETTGLLKPVTAENYLQPQVIELYLGVFDTKTFKIKREFNTLVKPTNAIGEQEPLESHIIRITNIDDEMLYRAKTFSQIAKKVSEFCKGIDIFLGQNVMFDYEILRHAYVKINKEKKTPKFENKICTVELSFPINNKRTKLGDLYELATGGKKLLGAHRAKDDAMATLIIYQWLLGMGF